MTDKSLGYDNNELAYFYTHVNNFLYQAETEDYCLPQSCHMKTEAYRQYPTGYVDFSHE